MSYYTRVECTWDDGDYVQGNLSVDDILPVAEKWLEQMNIHSDVLDDVAASINQPMETGFNGLYSSLIIDLFAHIAQAFPSVHFFVRGVGEEFDDMWLCEFQQGELVRQQDFYPPDEEVDDE